MSKPRPSYLPDKWENDMEMKGLMSLPKAKEINPIHHKKVVDFWTEIINEYCKYEKTCLFTLDELKQKFRRGTQIPGPLEMVMREMEQGKLIQRESDYNALKQGWLEWGYSKLFKSATPSKSNDQFVNLPALDYMANNLLQFYRVQYELMECPEVVDYNHLKAITKDIVSVRCFDLVINRLVEMGEVSIGSSSLGHKILKFKEQSSRGPARITDTDASVHDLRTTMSRLEGEIKKFEERMIKLEEEARVAYRKGDKKSALMLMKRKKIVEREITSKDKQYQNLLQMLNQIAQSKQTKEILDIYRESSSAFKAALQRQGLTVDNVDTTLDDVNDAMRDIRDVEDALRDGLRGLPSSQESMDESELESELNELLAESGEGPLADEAAAGDASLQPQPDISNKARNGKRVLDLMADLPDVPGNGILFGRNGPAARRVATSDGDQIEARWKRLRAE